MTQSLISVGLFLALLACLPFAIKWVKIRSQGNVREVGGQSRFVSAVAVGPHQRVVTVEVGPEDARVWLTLGVTPQSITCLHSAHIAPSTRSHTSETSGPLATNI
jgi:flagellar protein FliO/FliZ